jgi:hypothetical protein
LKEDPPKILMGQIEKKIKLISMMMKKMILMKKKLWFQQALQQLKKLFFLKF